MKNQPNKKNSAKNQPAQTAERYKLPLSPFSKGIIITVGVMSLILIILTMLDSNGLHLKWPEVIPIGSTLIPIILLIWGAVSLYNRVKTDKGRRIYRVVSILVLMSLVMFVLTFMLQYTGMMLPHEYAVIKSPTGQKISILYVMDLDMGVGDEVTDTEKRIMERLEYIQGEAYDPETPVDEYPNAAYGYIYAAYPVKYGIFYSSDVEVEGLIYRGMESKSSLRYEWLDDSTLNLYLENPEPGDSGTCRLNLHTVAAAVGSADSQ